MFTSLIWVNMLFSTTTEVAKLKKPDTIDVSNLNRQFLFREADVGKSKAEVAAAFVEKRVRGIKITPYNGKIQDKDEEYYRQFHVIVCGLDSIEARRWINATLVDMVDPEDLESFKPFVDGGTEGRCKNPALRALCCSDKSALQASKAKQGSFCQPSTRA